LQPLPQTAGGGGNSLQNNTLEATVAASAGLNFDLCSTRNFSTFYNLIISATDYKISSFAENLFGYVSETLYMYMKTLYTYMKLWYTYMKLWYTYMKTLYTYMKTSYTYMKLRIRI
jgi:hypothetical protein